MILGFNFFDPSTEPVYSNGSYLGKYNKIELRNAVLDELFVDSRVYMSDTSEKPDGWDITTILNANFQNSIEAGSIKLAGLIVDTLRFQKRLLGSNQWEMVGDVKFESGNLEEYIFLDKNIQNHHKYQYSVMPMSQGITGERIISDAVTALFEGAFISDRDNNYNLLYNLNLSSITHNVGMHTIETLNSPYPYIIFDNTNYRSGNISATVVFDDNINLYSDVDIEYDKRRQFINFLTNKEPKTLRFMNGDSLVISVVGQPVEEFIDGVTKYMNISFDYVEIDSFDTGGLTRNNLYEVIGGDTHG